MKQITLTKTELQHLQIWADNVMHGGHWGNGDIIFPDEQGALDFINNVETEEPVEVPERILEILLIWSEKAPLINPEEQILHQKLQELVKNSPETPKK